MNKHKKSATAKPAIPASQVDKLAPLSKPNVADNTAGKQRGRPFFRGQSGNPAGRPKGARNRLSEAYLAALLDDFQQYGDEAIAQLRMDDPKAYLPIITVLTSKLSLVENHVHNSTASTHRVMVVDNYGTPEQWEAAAIKQQAALVEESGAPNKK